MLSRFVMQHGKFDTIGPVSLGEPIWVSDMAKCAQVMNRSVVLTWVMYQSHRAGKIRTNEIFLLRLLDPEIN
jgi:hypothetical protein